MSKTNTYKETRVGDEAVEGLLSGILAGLVMAGGVVVLEMLGGVPPLNVLGYFDATQGASPWLGLFTHVAVSGMYGVVFGMLALGLAKRFGTRMSFALWLGAGALYGMLIFGIAEWVILPRSDSPLREMPLWSFALAHLFYGAVLAALWVRHKNGGRWDE